MVGTLTGGESRCDSAHLNSPDWYGMFSYSWDKNGTDSTEVLKYWLDPDSTDVMTMNGWTLSVPESPKNEWVSVFPNPVSDQLRIQFASREGKNVHFAIRDIWSNDRFRGDWNAGFGQEQRIDMSGLAAGIYFIVITDGNRQMVRKLVKQ